MTPAPQPSTFNHQPRNRHRLAQRQANERGAEAGCEVSLTQGQQLRVIIAFDGHRHRIAPIGGAFARARPLVQSRLDDPLASRQFGLSEKAGTAFAHRQQRLAIDGRIELEPEEVRVPLSEEVQHTDVVVDCLASLRQLVMKGDDRIEQPVTRKALRLEVDPQPTG